MKTEIIFEDKAYQEKTRKELQNAKEALQDLLDCWIKLDLGTVPDNNLFNLTYRTADVYNEAVYEVAEVPVTAGKFQLNKDVFMKLLNVPIPNDLYLKANAAKKHSWTGVPTLWYIDGDNVIMNQDEADKFIYANNITITNEDQKKFVKAVYAYLENGNYLYQTLQNLPGFNAFTVPFTLIEKGFPLLPKLQLEVINLKNILDKMNHTN